MVNKREHTDPGTGYKGAFIYKLIKRLIALIILGSFICIGIFHASQPLQYGTPQAINVSQQCGNSHPPGLNYCIPFDIYNSQATIANGTQIPVWFNSSNALWSSYLTPNADNICFYDGNTGACMPAWLEGNPSSYSVTGNFNTANVPLLYWIKTDANIPTGTTPNLIYMGIFPTNADNYGTGLNGILGANPTFNCSTGCPSTYYGGADNGANVFDLYDNFKGNYADNGVVTGDIDDITSAQNSDWTVKNGLIFNGAGNCAACGFVYISGGKYALLNYTEDLAFDADIHPFYGILSPECVGFNGSCIIVTGYCYEGDGVMGFYSFNSSSETPVNSIDMGALVDGSTGCTGNPITSVPQQDYLYSNNGVVISRAVFQPQKPLLPYTLVLQNGDISVQNLYNNSNIYTNKTAQYPGFTNKDVFAISNSWVWRGENWDPYSDTIQWIRIRTPPPNNIFPLVLDSSLFMAANQTTATTTSTTSTTTVSSSTTLETTSTTLSTSTIPQEPTSTSSTVSSSSTTIASTSTYSSSTSLATTTANSTTTSTSISPTTSSSYATTSTVQTSTIPASITNTTQSQNSTSPETPESAGALNIVPSGGGYVAVMANNYNPLFQNPNSSINNTTQNTVADNLTMPKQQKEDIPANEPTINNDLRNASPNVVQNSTTENTAPIFAQDANDQITNSSVGKPADPAQEKKGYTLMQMSVGIILASLAIAVLYIVARRKLLKKRDREDPYETRL